MDRHDPRYLNAVRVVRAMPRSRYCFVSGQVINHGSGDPHHVLPVSLYPEYAYLVANIVIVHRSAHQILTRDDPREVARLPRIHNLLARMTQLNYAYYVSFKAKLQPWIDSQNGWALHQPSTTTEK